MKPLARCRFARILAFVLLTKNSLETTKLSSEGEVIIPKSLREAHRREPGQELVEIATGDGILLKPKKPFAETTSAQVAGCLKYAGVPKSLEAIDAAIRQVSSYVA